jgi:cytochrome c biogenesis protein CcmG/thiol:disulfide interchange protein DsbE
MKFIKHSIPLVLFLFITALLWKGLQPHSAEIPSPLINKTLPSFSLPNLFNPSQKISNTQLQGKVILLNVWASWCSICANENDFLLYLSKQPQVILYGMNYRDSTPNAKRFLQRYGNPFRVIFTDEYSDTAIDLGVYGTPETFVIDKKGKIRYKYVGGITQSAWQQTLKPLITRLWNESE